MPYCDRCGRQLALTEPDRKFALTIFFGALAALFFYLRMVEAGAAFVGLTGAVGGIYAYSRRGLL